jgi:hypothetical protein
VLVLSVASSASAQSEERKLAEIPEGVQVAVRTSPASNLWYFERRTAIAWGDDGRTVAYVGERGSEKMPVVGATAGDPYDRVSPPVIAGGRAFFHVANQTSESTEEHQVWIDGHALRGEDWIGGLGVSPDGSRVAYWTHPGAKFGNAVQGTSKERLLVIARRRSSGAWKASRSDAYTGAAWQPPTWCADGSLFVTCGLARKGWAIVTVDKRTKVLSEGHDQIAAMAVSANGSAVAFVATDHNGEQPELIFRGKRVGERHDHVARPVVSPDGRHVAYVVTTDEGATVTVDNQALPESRYGHVQEVAFSRDGSRLAFVAVVGGAENERYPGVVEGGKWFVVVRSTDGKGAPVEHPPHRQVRDVVWDTTGERVAFAALDEGWRIVCGEHRSESFPDVGRPQFLTETNAVGHGARSGRELWWKVLPLD